MKSLASLLTIAAIGLCPLAAGERREFQSADGSKTFRGTLVGFNAGTSAVKVRHENGRLLRFKLALLSEKDREYVREKAPILAAADGLKVDTDLNRKGLGKKTAGRWICEKVEYSYDVVIESRLSEMLDEVEFEYAIFIERNRRDAEPRSEIVTGIHIVETFLSQGEESFTTRPVILENWSDNPPLPSGGGGG